LVLHFREEYLLNPASTSTLKTGFVSKSNWTALLCLRWALILD